jgi:hypothetical protein
MRSLMAILANARSTGVRVTRSFVRNGMTRTRGFSDFQPRSAEKRSRKPHRTGLKAKAKVCSPNSKSYFETNTELFFAKVHAILFLILVGVGTITHGLSVIGRDRENCSRYCENIVNITLREINRAFNTSHKMLPNKELALFPKWPISCGTNTTCPLSLVPVSLVPNFSV